jgi:tetratricopeptide (TPR) repeat protein
VRILLLASVVLLASPPVGADDRAEARRLFVQGDRAFAAGDFAAALETYTAAYQAAPLPGFLFNIGQCHRRLEHWQEAKGAYQRYLAEVPRAFNRADVERLIEEVSVHLRAALPAPVAPQPVAPVPEPTEPTHRIDTTETTSRGRGIGLPAWLTLGAGVALAVGAVVFAVDLESAQGEFDDLDCASRIDRCRDLRDRGDSAALLRTVLGGASLAFLAAGAVFLTLDLTATADREPGPEVRVSIGPDGIRGEGTF